MKPNECITNLINSPNNFKIFHQNVRGLANKIDEFLLPLSDINPHILCTTEHHLRPEEINIINLGQYTLGAHYCRRHSKQGGVSIFILNNIIYEVIDLNQFNKEKDLEICDLKIKLMLTYLIVLCIYRSPSGNFSYFIIQIEMALNKLYKISSNIIVCGDFNVNFLDSSSKAPLLKLLYYSFSLESTVDFPTRIMHSSQTLIDNIFLDKKNLNTITYPFINGILDHDGQIVTLLDVTSPSRKTSFIHIRETNDYSILRFVEFLSYETWDTIFSNDNTNKIFNSFLDIYLKIFQTCFPLKKRTTLLNCKPWLTEGIKNSCTNKKKLYEKLKYNKDTSFNSYYKKY
jgi:exonuclease III